MTLDQYLLSSKDTAAALAGRLGISEASISRIRRGEQNVSLAFARRVEVETRGKVKVSDLEVPEAA